MRYRGTLYEEVLYKKYIETRNNHFHLIKQKKQENQNQFLEGLEGEKIYTTIRILKRKKTSFLPPLKNTRGPPSTTFKGKCKILIEDLLLKPTQTPRPNWEIYNEDINQEWPEVTDQEIQAAILSASKTSTLGEDQLSYQVIKEAYRAIPDILNQLYKALISHGYHPSKWKQA